MDDVDSSLFLFRALAGPMTAVIAAMISLTVFAPIILYVIARWRANRDQLADSQLGVKFALHYFAMTALHLALAAGTLLVFAMISNLPSDVKSPIYRSSFGLLVPAGIVLAAHLSLLGKTNDAIVPGVRRLFMGYNLIVVGLFGFLALIASFESLFQKGSSGEMGRIAGAMVLVYGTAWAVIGYRFGQLALGLSGSSGSSLAPPGPPANIGAPPPAATPGLPSLGDGAFPPIDPR